MTPAARRLASLLTEGGPQAGAKPLAQTGAPVGTKHPVGIQPPAGSGLLRLAAARPAIGWMALILVLAPATVGCGGTDEEVPKIVLSQDAGVALEAGPAPTGVEATPAGTDVTGLAYELFEGGTRTLGHYRGRPLVVNFFAAWCPPCVAEMPEFQAVFEQLGGEVAFLGLSQDRTAEEALDLVARTGVGYDIGWDPDLEACSEVGGMAMPTTAFVTAEGELAEVYSGVLNEQALLEHIDRIRG